MSGSMLTPSFLALLMSISIIEFYWRKQTGRDYQLGALGGTIGVAIGQTVSKALSNGVIAGCLVACHQLAPFEWPIDDWRAWVVGFFAVEFAYYWQHRFSHTVRWLWTNHAVHHSPNEFVLPAAIRLGWTSLFSGSWIYFLPLAAAGMPPLMIGALLIFNLRYQFFLHTEAIGKLGPFEWIFNTPSHHRVHHGSNSEYLDKNFGGVLIIFDRIFGTFAEERGDNPVVYGLTEPLETNNPIAIAFHEWRRLFGDLRNAQSLGDIALALFGRPGRGKERTQKREAHA